MSWKPLMHDTNTQHASMCGSGEASPNGATKRSLRLLLSALPHVDPTCDAYSAHTGIISCYWLTCANAHMHSDTCYAPLCLNKSQKTDLSLVHMEKACTARASTPTAVRYSTVHHCTVHFFTLHYSALLYSATADLSKKIRKSASLG